MNQVIHFEIPSRKPHNLVQFFRSVFDWQFEKHPEATYYLTDTQSADEPGIEGAIYAQDAQLNSMINVIAVEDIESKLNRIVEHGGERLIERRPVTGLGWVAYFKDPEGTVFGLWQDDKNAR